MLNNISYTFYPVHSVVLLLLPRKMVPPCRAPPNAATSKVKKIKENSLDLIPSPSDKIQIMGGKVCLRCKGKTLLGVVNKLLKTKHLWTSPSNAM